MSIEESQNVNDILNRIKAAYQLHSDVELAKLLGKAPSTISTWRRRGSVDYGLIFAICQDLNANYILYGDLPVKRFRETVVVNDPPLTPHRLFIEKIESLSLAPDVKMELLQAWLDILEEKEQR